MASIDRSGRFDEKHLPGGPRAGMPAAGFRDRGLRIAIIEQFDTASDTWLASDQAGFLERDGHLVDGGWADAEVALHIGGRRNMRE
jgi:hypothetical protein